MTDRIGFVSDHAGFGLKEVLKSKATAIGFSFVDFGPEKDGGPSLDYPDQAAKLARALRDGSIRHGVAICGTGIGISISLNRFPHIRAALVGDEFSARMTRAHNDSNVICFGARVVNHDRAADFLEIWLKTQFEGGRHAKRVERINASFEENR